MVSIIILIFMVITTIYSERQIHHRNRTRSGERRNGKGNYLHELSDKRINLMNNNSTNQTSKDDRGHYIKIPLRTGAIMMLVSTHWKSKRSRKCHFTKSMDSIMEYYHPHNKYPIILMNTNGWKNEDMREIRKRWVRLDIMFLDISQFFFQMPSIPESQFEDASKPLSNIRFKLMCSFFFQGFLKVPLLMEFHYLLRMDDDTCFDHYINYDIFSEMKRYNAAYGFHTINKDYELVTKGLFDHFTSFIRKRGYKFTNNQLYEASKKVNEEGHCLAFSTNLEVINTVKYQHRRIQAYIKDVMDNNYIFHRRWGDANLRITIAQMVWKEGDILRLCDFGYEYNTYSEAEGCDHRSNINNYFVLTDTQESER